MDHFISYARNHLWTLEMDIKICVLGFLGEQSEEKVKEIYDKR